MQLCEDQWSYRKPDTFPVHVSLISSLVWNGFCWHKGSNLALARLYCLVTQASVVLHISAACPATDMLCWEWMQISWFLHARFLPLVSCFLQFKKCWSNLCALHREKKKFYLQCKLLVLFFCHIKKTLGNSKKQNRDLIPSTIIRYSKQDFANFWKKQDTWLLDKCMQLTQHGRK